MLQDVGYVAPSLTLSQRHPQHCSYSMAPAREDNDDLSWKLLLPHFICPVCRQVPAEPLALVPCEHLLCQGCVRRLGKSFPCPVCRSMSSSALVKPLKQGSLLHRIWSDVYSLSDVTTTKKVPANGRPETRPAERPSLISVTRTVHVETYNGLYGLQMMLLGMVTGFAMHVVWPRRR